MLWLVILWSDRGMSEKSWIDINPAVMGGRACIRDTRVPVETIIMLANEGYSVPDLLFEYPYLTEQDLACAKTYADRVGDEGERAGGAP